jgi:hypothetical protein
MYVVRHLLALVGASLATCGAAKDESKIAVFGSSVARGCCQGLADSPVSYANQLTNYQRDYEGRTVINVSKGGGIFVSFHSVTDWQSSQIEESVSLHA